MQRDVTIDDVIVPTNVPGHGPAALQHRPVRRRGAAGPRGGPRADLQRVLQPAIAEYDVILIDCQPSLGLLTVNALTASDGVIVPLECEYFALRGVALLKTTIDKVSERLNPQLEIDGVLGTMYDGRTLHGREVMERLVEAWGDTVFHTVIRRTVKFSESTVAGEPITTLRLDARPAPRPTGSSPRRCSRGVSTREHAGGRRAVPPHRRTRPTPLRTPTGDAGDARSAEAGQSGEAGAPAAGSGTTRRSRSTSPPTSCSHSSTPGWRCAREHGLAVDRGRIVREAVALVLADLEQHGDDSVARAAPDARHDGWPGRESTGAGPEAAPAFAVHLDNFEGPFDLLLSLIAKHKLDVTEVALSKVTDEFIAHIKAARTPTGTSSRPEFLVVAATLLDLKAARLLPPAEVEDEEDLALLEARDLLFARLLQYRAFKQVAAVLRDAHGRRGPAATRVRSGWRRGSPTCCPRC